MPYNKNNLDHLQIVVSIQTLSLIIIGVFVFIQLVIPFNTKNLNINFSRKRKPKVVAWGSDDIDSIDIDFEDIEFSFVDENHYKYVPKSFFPQSTVKEIDERFVNGIVRTIADTMQKRNIQLSFRDYNLSQQLLTIFFKPEDVVNQNGTTSYFDVGKCERALTNIKTALGSNNVQFNAVANNEGLVSYTIGVDGGNSLMLGDLYDNFTDTNLEFIVGKDTADEIVYSDITQSPHMLVVGSTGSGKSCFLRQMISQLATNKLPNELEIWASDVKLTELAPLQGLPHLKTFASTLPDTVKMLEELLQLMNRRNQILLKAGSPDVLHYNYKNNGEKLPIILVLIEEFLLLTSLDENEKVQTQLQGLLSSSRSAGIHFVIATQVANATVLPTELRANLPTKAVFKLGNKSENSVLGTSGAHLLSGNGDMMFVENGMSRRIQSPFISSEEFAAIINYLK